MKGRKKLLGKEHTDKLSSMAMVGLAKELAKRWTEAEELFVQVMKTNYPRLDLRVTTDAGRRMTDVLPDL